jgi:hypothetical protein
MTRADSVHSTPPLNTSLADELSREVEQAGILGGIVKVRAELMARIEAALRAAAQMTAIGIPTTAIADPIYGAIEAHRAAYAAYDHAAEAPDEENDEAFRELDIASQQLMRAEASTLAGLTALLRYVAELLQEAGSPGLPIEVPFAGRWSAAFGTFCANVAERLPAILAAPEYVDCDGDAIVSATGDLFDDFEVARKAARAAIEAIAS